MNVEMIGNHNAGHVNDMDITYQRPAAYGSRMSTEKAGYSLDITGKVKENAAYGKEDLKSAEDIAQMAGMTNVSIQSDYMAVMSNSMSDEDFANLMKDGVNPTKIPAGETVTNLDRIKIKMAEAGTTIAGYNDDLTEEDVKAVLGNSINAGKVIADTLEAADLPATGDNVAGIKETVMMAQNLKPLSDEAAAYMISEDLEPTIGNLYKAEYSATATAHSTRGVHFDGAATYAGSEYTKLSWDELADQAAQIVKEAGIDNTDEVMADAKWIATHEIPLTADTIKAYGQIKDVKLPMDPRDMITAMTVAIEEGKAPSEANVLTVKSLYVRASEIVEKFRAMDDPADLTRHRQLEEVRLAMTTEANLTLLRKGINIETQPLEQLVEQLKEAEREFYAPLLADDRTADNNSEAGKAELDNRIGLYKQTMDILDRIPQMPVRVIAETSGSDDFSIGNIDRVGTVSKAAYEKAGETYEALMTAPRADMGDSIRKAFRNVDEILTGLDMDVNDANRKAVRTLGYAGMMINKEAVDSIRTATASVERVISLMTPARTLSMIRDGVNPISENIFELERSLSQESFEDSQEKYSRFLLRLEKSGNITEDEKQTFIGMYRLFNIIEKQDGRVIGNVLSSGRELTLKNMLEASRNNRHMNSEYIIDDDFGFLEEIVEKGDSVTSQIERAFMQMMDPAPDKEYIREKQREIRTANRTADAEGILEMISEPVTVENILAAGAMTGGMGGGYKKLFSQDHSFEDDKREDGREELTEEDARALVEKMGDRESAAAAYEAFLDKAGAVAKRSALASESYEDVRTYSMLYKQIGFASALASTENYEVPVLLEDGWSSIRLTIIHGKDETGKVRASFESEAYGRVDATFSLKTNGVDGFIVSDSRAGVDNLKNIDDKIREGFKNDHMDVANLSYVFSRNTNGGYIPDSEGSDVSNRELYRIAKAFIGAIQ
ncbi:MAG: hypothetical protein J5367_02810 [Lachnospiraceae bacterium]|nr:hypothetical protein [Lachnospiraceae bacterium]